MAPACHPEVSDHNDGFMLGNKEDDSFHQGPHACMLQEQIQFPQRRFGLTRNAAARQAVMQKMRQPPMKAATPPMGTQKSLFDTQLFGAGVAPMQH